jgi:hypothetical protein
MRWLLALLVLASPGFGSAEQGLGAADLASIRAVISRQIEAFRRDDAHGAFALVSPGVQDAFGTPERFLETVRTSYEAVYRPATVGFLDHVLIGGGVVQRVAITDAGGRRWLAYFSMQRQRDGSWRTHGCHLVSPGRAVSA